MIILIYHILEVFICGNIDEVVKVFIGKMVLESERSSSMKESAREVRKEV
jgi:hypothetical protein